MKKKKKIIGIWKKICKVRIITLLKINALEEEAEEVDENVRTYENAVVLYEDKKYYPDAEEVNTYLSNHLIGFQRS